MAFGEYPADVDYGHYGQLKCKCGSEYLHQRNITIFECNEDDDWVTVIAQNGHTVQATKFPNADTCNPSPRRHGLILEFECEGCSYDFKASSDPAGGEVVLLNNYRPKLAIFQHKGNTFIEWVD